MAKHTKEIPHPVLTGRSSDYSSDCLFLAEPSLMRRTGSGTIAVVLDYTVSAASIATLIEDRRAEFCVVSECDATKTRESHRIDAYRHPITLDASRYAGATKMRPHITTTESLDSFCSADWLPDVKEMLPNGISLPSGAILGRAAIVEFDAGGLISGESIFEIVPSANIEKGIYTLDISGERIVIQVCPDDLPAINQVRDLDERGNASIWVGMYQRAVEEGVLRHREDEHVSKRWAINIGKQLTAADMETDDSDILAARALEYAQRLMQNPLNRITEFALRANSED